MCYHKIILFKTYTYWVFLSFDPGIQTWSLEPWISISSLSAIHRWNIFCSVKGIDSCYSSFDSFEKEKLTQLQTICSEWQKKEWFEPTSFQCMFRFSLFPTFVFSQPLYLYNTEPLIFNLLIKKYEKNLKQKKKNN